jgi:hypothetical protein
MKRAVDQTIHQVARSESANGTNLTVSSLGFVEGVNCKPQ